MEYTAEGRQVAQANKLKQILENIKRQLPAGCSVEVAVKVEGRMSFDIKDSISRSRLITISAEELTDNYRIPEKRVLDIQDARSKITYAALAPSVPRPRIHAAHIEYQDNARLHLKSQQEQWQSLAERARTPAPKPQTKQVVENIADNAAQMGNKRKEREKDYHDTEYSPRMSPFKRVPA